MYTTLLICILFSFCSFQVNGYPSGVPAAACTSLTPMHGVEPQTTDIPFMIDISEFRDTTNDYYYYTPGRTYNSKEK